MFTSMQNNKKPLIAIVSEDERLDLEIRTVLEDFYDLHFFSNGIVFYNSVKRQSTDYTFILSVSDLKGLHGVRLKKTIDSLGFSYIPFY